MDRQIPPFNDEAVKLLLDRDFFYFLNEDFKDNNTSDEDRAAAIKGFNQTTAEVLQRYRKSKKQCRLWLEGMVRLQWHGGLLRSQFRLDGQTRGLTFFDYEDTGMNWAYFEFWQKLERRRRFWRITWDRITKAGAVLAIILSLIKLYEVLASAN